MTLQVPTPNRIVPAANRIIRDNIRNTLNNKVKGVADTNNETMRLKLLKHSTRNAAKDVKGGGGISKP